MNILHLPWLELAIALTLIGSPFVSRLRNPNRAYQWGLFFTGFSFACTLLAWLAFYGGVTPEMLRRWSIQPTLFGRQVLGMDELSAPLIPSIALLHFLAAMATSRNHMRRFSFSWSLAAEAIRLATFSCKEPWVLIGLLSVSTMPPVVELLHRGRPIRLYVIHMALFIGLLVLGWSLVGGAIPAKAPAAWWATLPLLAAILIRCGAVPAHCWLTDWFEHASLGIALLYVAPLTGVYAAVRLLMPIAPDSILTLVGFFALVSAVYAAGMATIQTEARRFFAHLFLSHASLVLIGLELNTDISLTGSLCLWFSVILSLGGFGLTLRALEARFGRLSLNHYHGLYEHSPTLAVCFLLTGLASVGFPCTIGFISTELLVDGAVEASSYVGIAVIAAAALNGIAVMRAYFLLFTGTRHMSTVSLGIGLRERIAVMTLSLLILAGGLYPQPGVTTRERAAEEILSERRFGKPAPSLASRAEHGRGKDALQPLSASTWMPRAIVDMTPSPNSTTK
ncbi:proton-conducting transporter transmembrane domain-containing protein [Singulisphaera acidiphila]|uniref:NADH:ubiquinone oxidoreductase subunit 4 (Chain M) n=1 Tax=Singulisphaera acidiphila (strain ATCC BAA-1392 / DSM 18658 / VKM B-2454 / MOB10) TaxID=886293 RepID=L0DK41_SINAD|nr:proton-conducting transporter membrane subunit [Singulisphaera acidiphila]AGA29210.1 NADH:ubiquinone oxidoreductase subunit 4 (chain M) [Singulisphaera acidiphila DSM 18658]